jgi:hypothetical protein
VVAPSVISSPSITYRGLLISLEFSKEDVTTTSSMLSACKKFENALNVNSAVNICFIKKLLKKLKKIQYLISWGSS